MYYVIDFNSEEAIYIQLRNQIILAIATASIREGDNLPSVREMADNIGINMHTVNKAYTILKQEGYIKLDRRKGAFISIDYDKIQSIDQMTAQMRVVLAEAVCKDISAREIQSVMEQIYREFTGRGLSE